MIPLYQYNHQRAFVFAVVLISSLLTGPTICKGHSINSINNSDDVIDMISETHVEVARCRLFCIKEFLGPRLLYQDINSVSYECTNTSISCNHCYEMCETLSQNKKEELTICNYENHMCFGGCRTACKYKFLSDNKGFKDKSPIVQDPIDGPEVVVKGCILYWHFHIKKYSETNLVMYQIYGKDTTGTWFDLGQTTRSYFENIPSIVQKCKSIRVLSIDQYAFFKLEYDLDQNILRNECDMKNSSTRLRGPEMIQIKPLFHSSPAYGQENLSDFTLKVVITLVLCLLVILLILFCIFRFVRQEKKLIGPQDVNVGSNRYEEINISSYDDMSFGAYDVKKGQITSLMNNHYANTVDLFEKKMLDHSQRNLGYMHEDKMEYFQMPKKAMEPNIAEANSQFLDVVSWLRTVNSRQILFDNFGFSSEEEPHTMHPIN